MIGFRRKIKGVDASQTFAGVVRPVGALNRPRGVAARYFFRMRPVFSPYAPRTYMRDGRFS